MGSRQKGQVDTANRRKMKDEGDMAYTGPAWVQEEHLNPRSFVLARKRVL